MTKVSGCLWKSASQRARFLCPAVLHAKEMDQISRECCNYFWTTSARSDSDKTITDSCHSVWSHTINPSVPHKRITVVGWDVWMSPFREAEVDEFEGNLWGRLTPRILVVCARLSSPALLLQGGHQIREMNNPRSVAGGTTEVCGAELSSDDRRKNLSAGPVWFGNSGHLSIWGSWSSLMVSSSSSPLLSEVLLKVSSS